MLAARYKLVMDEHQSVQFNARRAEPADFEGFKYIREMIFPRDRPYEDYIGHPSNISAVITAGAEIVGFSSALTGPPEITGRELWRRMTPYIASIGVHPHFRTRTLGSNLLQFTCGCIFHLTSFKSVFLECDRDVVPFYEKNGFRRLAPSEVEAMFGPNPTESAVCELSSLSRRRG